MSDFDRTNTGILSRNERKADERHADFTGSVNVEGVDYFLDAYVRERKDGSGKFFSLKLKRKDKQPQANGAAGGAKKPAFAEDIGDEIPF
jgi:hypothetical protein